jgi:hypothetical protein
VVRRRGAWLAAGILLLTASGCGLGSEGIEWTDSEPPLLVHRTEGGHDALIEGRLLYLSDQDCFVLESANEDSRYVPVWPPGSRPIEEDGETTGVDVRGFGEVPTGSWLVGGGGYLNPETSHREIPDEAMNCARGDHPELVLVDEVTDVTDGP